MEYEKQCTEDNEILICQSNWGDKALQVQINNGYSHKVGDSTVLQFLKNKRHGSAISAGLLKLRRMAHSTMTQDIESLWNDAATTCVNLDLMRPLSTSSE